MNIWENTMNLKQVIPIYQCEELYLYEIIEDYKQAPSSEEQDEIFHSFCSFVWSCNNKRKIYPKNIHFQVKKDLLDTELGQLFHSWSSISYRYYKSKTNEDHWCSYLRQKINNLYTRYFDPEVILEKEYMRLLHTPKRLYYEWISGSDLKTGETDRAIKEAMDEAEVLKQRLQSQKLNLSWNDYKKLIESFLYKCFQNCKLIEDYESKESILSHLDFLTEDHFYVRYLNRSLENHLRNYQKNTYGLKRGRNKQYKRCKQCGALIENSGNKKMYCSTCVIKNTRLSWNRATQKYRSRNVIK